jgi:tetratricopeptide (TPR) repeat protein
MARKRRSVETVNLPINEKKETPRYTDPFQQTVGKTIEGAGKKLEGQGRNILYGLGALLVLGVIVWIFYSWSGRSGAAAQTALGKAIEISQAQVTDQAPPAGSSEKTFKTEKERAEAAVAQFQKVADTYGGSVGEKAKYFAAVNKMSLDRAAAVSELDALAKSSGEVGKLAKFALANAKADDGQYDDAAANYKELAAMDDPIVAKETINFQLATVYEKQGKKQEAADVLFNLVKTASEAKDTEGKPLPLGPTAQSAKDKLKMLDPERASQIPEPAADDASGM